MTRVFYDTDFYASFRPMLIMQWNVERTSHVCVLHRIYKPYGDADKDAEHIALRRMGYQPANLMQSDLLCVD